MTVTAADMPLLSRLFDEATAQPAAELDAWLAALPEPLRHLEAPLREMLAEDGATGASPDSLQLPSVGSFVDDLVTVRPGEVVGPYRLIREIGHGGMGTVWLAERADGTLKRQVALKLPRLAWGAGLAERMARERDIGAILEHPNIARLYDAGVDQRGRPFLALEYIDGQPIDAWCESQGLSVRERLHLFVQVARAVAYAHGRLVVHRDLKPSNVLVTPDGVAHLLDFGIAKLLPEAGTDEAGLTQQQGRVMTPLYASPEQVAGDLITVQSDVYSLGVLLYELLTGTLPITPKRNTHGSAEEAILEGDAPLASSRAQDRATARSLRGELDAILAMAMRREPALRYATANAMALDVERHLLGETISARTSSSAYRLRKAVRRHWVGVTATTAVLVTVLGGAGAAVLQAQRAMRAAERERIVKEFVADLFWINSKGSPDSRDPKRPTTLVVLEGGAQLIEQRFANQPELQAELFGVVGDVFSDMGAYKLAIAYTTRKVESLARQAADGAEQARALLTLSRALIDDRKFAEAEPHLRRALALSGDDVALRLDALLMLAYVEYVQRGGSEAFVVALRDIDVGLARLGTAAHALRARALYLRAMTDSSLGLEKQVSRVQQAIDVALQADGPLSMTVINMRLEASHSYAHTQFFEEAQKQFDAGIAGLRQLGGAHEVRAAFQSAVFAAVRYTRAGTISAREAIATIERNRAALAEATWPMPDWFIPYVDFYLGLVQTNHGNVQRGLELIEPSVPFLRRSLDDSPGDRHVVLRGIGEVLMESGRHDEADRYFREVMEVQRSLGLERSPGLVTNYLYVTGNLLMQGRFDAAQSVLDQAPDYEAQSKAQDDASLVSRRQVSNWRLNVVRARLRYLRGDVGGALASLPALRLDTWPYELKPVLGEALCAAGRPREGLEVLQPLLLEMTQYFSPLKPRTARLRSVIGLCALHVGNRATALDLAAQARAAFAAQPAVSPYYKAPLITLERALGLKLPAV